MAKRRTNPNREAGLQAQVIKHLEFVTKCPRVIRVNSGAIVFKRGDGSKGFVKLAKTGTADVIACMPDGRFGAFETKGTKPEPTQEQWEFIEAVKRAGGIAGPVRSYGELETLLKSGGYR